MNLFPYTNFHELNLDWVLYKILELNSRVETSEENIKNLNTKLDKEIADRIAADGNLQSQITNNYNYLNGKIENLISKHNFDYTILQGEIAKSYLKSKDYTDSQIDELKKLINKPVPCPVFDYFEQDIVCLQKVLFDYYINLRDHALTAFEFDGLGLSCQELDNLLYTAYDWDINGKNLTYDHLKRWPWFGYDPYTGNRMSLEHIINNLYQYHYTGITCGEWDAMTYTAGEFDAAKFTAYTLDWSQSPKSLDKGD